MNDLTADNVQKLLNEVTKGKWRDKPSVHGNRYRYVQIGKDDSYTTLELQPADARLIAAAPTIAAAYIEQAATIARLTEERDRLREALEICAGSGPKKLNLHEDFLRREAVARAALKEG